ncbi:putative protein FAR1-RELATED SEQUENCE 10 [Bidens hawaiensis]|uniref:putative protein FAR1-RELATED SEQUENCE 10 n=1 Tax=Bidens hawaiensis TaxID=980011 RepID=UPI00404ABD1B
MFPSFIPLLQKLMRRYLDGQVFHMLLITNVETEQPNCEYSSNGIKFWIPNVPSNQRPSIGLLFQTWEDVVAMYKAYADKADFDVRKSTIIWTKGVISHRYLFCSKSGSPRCKDVDTMDTSSSSTKRRNTNIKVTGCKACIRLKLPPSGQGFEIYHFVEAHNHGLVSDYNMDLTRGRRKLQFSDKEFIHGLQTMGFGPTIAHRVQSSLKGGQHPVTGSKNDFKNYVRNVNSVIGDADAQIVVDKFSHNMLHLEKKIFQYKAVDGLKGELKLNEEIKCRVNKLVWNVFIKPETFESRWHDLIEEFNLGDNKW